MAAELPKRANENVPLCNTTRYTVFSLPWQMHPPRYVRAVVAKATYVLGASGPVALADEQLPPSGDVYVDDDPEKGMLYATDFAVWKPKADVLVVGHVHRGGGIDDTYALGTGVMEVRVGGFSRRIAVFGDRKFGTFGVEDKPLPFDKIPLRHEFALGGPLSRDNPVGRGYRTGVMLPNLEWPDRLVTGASDAIEPACTAPVNPHWPMRRGKLGTFDSAWQTTRWPFYPADFDWAYHNAATPSMQTAYFRGDEEFVLSGVRPKGGGFSGALPGRRPRILAKRFDSDTLVPIPLALDTLHFDADAGLLIALFRGTIEVSDEDAPELEHLFILEESTKEPLGDQAIHERYVAEMAVRTPPTVATAFDPIPKTSEKAEAPPVPLSRDAVLSLLLSGAGLAGVDLSDVDLSGADLSGKNLAGALLARANLRGAKLSGASFAGAVLTFADLTEAAVDGADLSEADCTRAKLRATSFAGAKLDGAVFDHVDAHGARFDGASCPSATFAEAALAGASFREAILTRADFSRAELSATHFDKAKLDNASFYHASGDRTAFSEASMNGARLDGVSLENANFAAVAASGLSCERGRLPHANWLGAVVDEAIFQRAVLEYANLSQVSAKGAVFRRANLSHATMIKANFESACLERADARHVDARGANLFQANLWLARTLHANFELAHLAGTHLAPPP